jgi:3-oxoadipate enol-lactonase
MSNSFNKVKVGDLDIQYELVDYTAPWRKEPPETILLYHGYSRNMLFWQEWVAPLAGDYRVLRFDARGCGGTTHPPAGSRYTMEQLIADAVGLLDALDIARVHWVGESSGGIVGMETALAHPVRMASLTLCDTPFKRSSAVTTNYALGAADRTAAIEQYGFEAWCRKTLEYRLDTNQASAEYCEWFVKQMARTPAHIAIALGTLFGAGNLWPRLPEVHTPTLIISGSDSKVAPSADVEAMQQRMPNAKLVSFDGYGQCVNFILPQRCASEVLKFIAALS